MYPNLGVNNVASQATSHGPRSSRENHKAVSRVTHQYHTSAASVEAPRGNHLRLLRLIDARDAFGFNKFAEYSCSADVHQASKLELPHEDHRNDTLRRWLIGSL